MALTTCSECKGQVSTTAAACPHCGAKVAPAVVAKPGGLGAAGSILLVGGAMAVGLVMCTGKDNGEARRQADMKCRADIKCWGERHLSAADAYCQRYVERLALHSVKWTDTGSFDQKFSRFRWLNQEAGTVTYIGDKVEFQNAFGAFTPMIYSCDIGDLDKEKPQVIEARILSEGRLPP